MGSLNFLFNLPKSCECYILGSSLALITRSHGAGEVAGTRWVKAPAASERSTCEAGIQVVRLL